VERGKLLTITDFSLTGIHRFTSFGLLHLVESPCFYEVIKGLNIKEKIVSY